MKVTHKKTPAPLHLEAGDILSHNSSAVHSLMVVVILLNGSLGLMNLPQCRMMCDDNGRDFVQKWFQKNRHDYTLTRSKYVELSIRDTRREN